MQKVRKQLLQATISAVSWTVTVGDDFDPLRITLNFATAPTTSEDVTLTIDAATDATFDELLIAKNAAGQTSLVFTDIPPLHNGDKFRIEYTNTDAVSVTGAFTFQI